MREKLSKQLSPAPSTVGPCSTITKISRTPRHWNFIQHMAFNLPEQIFQMAPQREQMSRMIWKSMHKCMTRTTSIIDGDGGWCDGCFALNGPLRQYFSLYRAVSQKKEKRNDRGEKKCPNKPHPHLLQAH